MLKASEALSIAIFADNAVEQMPEISDCFEDVAQDKALEILGRNLKNQELDQVYSFSELEVCEHCHHYREKAVMWEGVCDECASDAEEE